MTTRARILALAAAISLAGPEAASAGSYFGNLGLRYDRSETWTPAGDYHLIPALRFDGNLGADSFLYDPAIAVWNASVGYGTLRQSDSGESTNVLTYGLGLGLFKTRRSMLPIDLRVDRSTVDHSLATSTDTQTGTSTSDTYSVGGGLNLPGRPSLRFGASRIETTTSGFGHDPWKTQTDSVSAGLRHGPGPYDVDVSYDGRFGTGSLQNSDYEEHLVRLGGSALAAPGVMAYAAEIYQQRLARSVAEYNPTSESNAFGAGVRWSDPQNTQRASVDYHYSHGVVEAPLLETTETTSHSLGATGDRTFSPTWSGNLSAAASVGIIRLGNTQQTGAGQNVGATATWSRQVGPRSSLSVQAGPTIGLVEPSDGPTAGAYGGVFRTKYAFHEMLSSLAAEYQLEYRDNLDAQQGWSLGQRLRAEGTATLGARTRVLGYVTAMGSRAHQDLLGDTMSRSLQAVAQLFWWRYTLESGVLYSANPTVFSGGANDGLFIPAKFSSTSLSAYTSLSLPLTRRLAFAAGAHYASAFGAATPSQTELGVFGNLTYNLGLFRLTVQDRYVTGGTLGLDVRQNFFSVLVSRSLGGRF